VNDFIKIGAATSPVLGFGRIGEAATARCAVPPVHKVKGTGLPFAGVGTHVGVVGVGMGADQLQGMGVDRITAAADPGIPPRRWPVRC
jgi:hypothetical protein